MTDSDRSHAVAIVGMAGRFPGASGLDGFWQNIRGGVESLEQFSDADLDAARVDPAVRAHPAYVRKGTVLEGADQFDASFFGFSPREAQILDPQQRIFLECAWEAIEHAGHAGSVAGQSVGVYAGVGINVYLLAQLLANPAFVASVGGYQLMIGNDKDFLSTRVSYKLDLRGPSVSVQTACSTSLVAVAMACRALQRGECDMALAGGVSIVFPQRAGYLFEEGMIFSPDGHCRPFDAKAQGTRGGSGAGIVVLKRLADAVADRDTIHAVILGSAMNNDGAAKAGYTAPSVDGQVEVIATAQALAGVDARSIGYVEAHGTATPLGDPIEIAALTQAFRATTADSGFCRIGSLKANLGHLDAAAGVAGLIKTVLALTHRELPPLVNFQSANPQLSLDTSPFVASASAAPWPAASGTPRRAGVSSFGIGGTNAHLVLEEAPPVPAADAAREAHLLVLSAKTPTALDRATVALADHLRVHPELSLADVEYTLEVGRQRFPHRRAVVVRDREHALALLAEPQRAPVLNGAYDGGARPIAFLFSGQGSQHVGMGADLYRTERVYREAFDRCAVTLEPHLGLDLRTVVFGAPEDRSINETRLTQPALFAVEYALASLWMSRGIVPSAMLGHSIGEYVAAHLAGVMSLDDALALVAARGRLMQALPAGSMAAVHLPAAELERLLVQSPEVEIAAVNAPELCAVSGPHDAIAAFGKRLEANGVDFRLLHTSHAFHSAMMEPALAPFEELLQRITLSPPQIPYLSNVTGDWITDEQATSPGYYARHLRQAVQFASGVRALAADPTTLLLEVGPGNALTSLARLTLGKDASKRVLPSLSHPRERRSDVETMLETTGRMWLVGTEIDWQTFHNGSGLRRVPLPTYPFERKRHWVDAQPVERTEQSVHMGRPGKSIDEWLFAPTWTRDDTRAATPQLGGSWLVLAPKGPLGEAVARRVAAAGAEAIVLSPASRFERHGPSRFSVRADVADDIAAVVRQVRDAGGIVAGVIHLWSTAPENDAQLALSYHSLVGLAAAVQPSPDAPLLVIVATTGAESVLDEPVHAPGRAMVRGPVLSLPTEVPGLRMRSVDVELTAGDDSIELAAGALVEEAANRDGENMVARRAGRRWVRRFERLALPASGGTPLPLKPRGVYLITGGLGGIGLSLAKWLATETSARLLLTGRSAMPARDEWDGWLAAHPADDRTCESIRAIREIELAGGEVLAAAADAADAAAMRSAIELARTRWGSIDGIVHAAGVAGNGRIAFLKEAQDVAAVLAPKVSGLAVLIELLGETPLDFVVLLSSINSLLGAPGLADYASANAVLDAFVDSASRPAGWRQVAAINYAPWREVGMASRLFEGADAARRGANEGFRQLSISPAAGTEAFARVLASGRRQAVVIPQDLPYLMELVRARDAGSLVATPADAAEPVDDRASAVVSVDDRPAVSTPYEAPASDTERRLAEIWSELLGVERIGMQDDFFELGGHSLLATRVLSRIDQALGARLTLRDIFDAPTVRRLADRVAATGAGAARAPSATDADREEMEF